MGGRGSSSGTSIGGGAGSKLSASRKETITNGIKTHTKEQNDRAEVSYKRSIAKEREVVENASAYIRSGYIKNTSDPWFIGHVESLNSLNAQFKFFKKERKRLGR